MTAPKLGLADLFRNDYADPQLKCSRARCTNPPETAIVWRNPKIHAADKHKTWLSCSEHSDYLRDFVAARGFLKEVISLADLHARETNCAEGCDRDAK